MNIFKWLKDKAGKMPVTVAQAAGITAVVGAAGFAAMTYLSSPADNNTSFIPPSAYEQQGDVVYVSRSGGGGQYEGRYAADGSLNSSLQVDAAPINLLNKQYEQQQRVRAMEEADVQPSYAGQDGADSVQLPKAYQMGAGETGLGMGTSGDKQLNAALDFSNLQKEIPGISDIVNKAQAQANASQQGASGDAGGSNAQAAKFTKASTDYTRVAGGGSSGSSGGSGGSGGNNTFVIQDSGKNMNSKEMAGALAQAKGAMADAQNAINGMKEGSRMRSSRASFGRSDGLGDEKNAHGQGSRMGYGNAAAELKYIRKRSAEIDRNKTNSANEGGRPFLASAKISGGLTVDGENITTGQGSSSGDLDSTDRQMRGLKGFAAGVQAGEDERNLALSELQNWMWQIFAAVAALSIAIGVFLKCFRGSGPIAKWIFLGLAIAATIAAVWMTVKLFDKVATYVNILGGDHDKWSTIGYVEGGVLLAGIATSWLVGMLGKGTMNASNWKWLFGTTGALVGGAFLGGGFGFYHMLSHKDQYLKDVEQANKGESQTSEQNKVWDEGDK